MIPVIAARGTSFAGAFVYYCHDKQAWTSQRVAWTQCLNLMTDCVQKAWKRMAYTAQHQEHLKRSSGQAMTGVKMQKPVFSYSLSWHPEENPSEQSMMEAVMETLHMLGLAEHQAIVAAHRDEPHPHVHVVVNAVHPLTGLVAKLKNTKRKLSKFALNYERKEGKVYCPQREENHSRYEAGQKTKYCDPVIAKAWQGSVNGSEFVTNLSKHGYQLAKGRRVVIVDPHGNILNPARELGIKSKKFMLHMGGLKIDDLISVNEALATLKDESKQRNRNASPKALPLELENLQAQITGIKGKLCQEGMLAKCFGVSAYRKRRLCALRRDFQRKAKSVEYTKLCSLSL